MSKGNSSSPKTSSPRPNNSPKTITEISAQSVINGDLDLTHLEGDLPLLKEIKGDAFFIGWKGSADNLETIGGDLYMEDSWIGTAKNLKEIKGEVKTQYYRDQFDNIQKIGKLADDEFYHCYFSKLEKINGRKCIPKKTLKFK